MVVGAKSDEVEEMVGPTVVPGDYVMEMEGDYEREITKEAAARLQSADVPSNSWRDEIAHR